jgi:hypothetical protein
MNKTKLMVMGNKNTAQLGINGEELESVHVPGKFENQQQLLQ